MKRLLIASLAGFMLCACKGPGTSSTEGSSDDPRPPKEYEYQTVSKATIRDKVLGSWIGNAIGLGSGYEYVVSTDNWSDVEGAPVEGYTVGQKTALVALHDRYWEPNGAICSGSIGVNALKVHPINDPRVTRNAVYSDDDMHVDIMEQFLFRDYGPKLGVNDIAKAWRFYDVHDAGGGSDTANLTKNAHYVSPYTGQSTYGSLGYWVTEAWIENDSLGLLFPYMYQTAEGYADMFCQVQGDAYGYFLGKLCAMMVTLAYEHNDAKIILEEAFKVMGTSNEMWPIYQYVKKCYESRVSWRQACIGVVERSVNCARIRISDMAGFSLNALGGMIFIGLMYGENDFEESLRITSLCGLDGDCTAATVGAVIGTMLGYEAIPAKYKAFLNNRSTYYNHTGNNGYATGVYWPAFAYCGKNFPNAMTFDDLTDLTVSNIESVIEGYHGSVGESEYRIAKQPLQPVDRVTVDNYSFEKGNTDSWNVSGDATLIASTAGVHLGTYGGVVELGSETSEAKVFQHLNLKKGHTYKTNLWVNGAQDREFHLYASDGSNEFYRAYVNPVSLGNRHMKGELVFTATANTMDVGIAFPKSFEDVYSVIINIDDLFLDDITYYQSYAKPVSFQGEAMELDGLTARVSKDGSFSEGQAAHLESDDSASFEFEANGEVQSVRLYYQNQTNSLAAVTFLLDDEIHVADLPIVGTGVNGGYNVSNYASMDCYFPKGKHKMTLLYNSFDAVEIDRVEIRNASAYLEG